MTSPRPKTKLGNVKLLLWEPGGYLFNNKGATTFADSAATFDPRKRATVSVKSGKLGPCRVTDLVSGEIGADRTESFKMGIDPGAFCILRLEPKP